MHEGSGDYGEFDPAVQTKVFEIVAEQFGKSVEEITMESSYANDLGGDSLDLVELVMEYEDEFDINIPDDEVEDNIQTVGQSVVYISREVKKKGHHRDY